MKDSGLGRSHSKFGFYECVNIKLVTWEPSRTRDFWWHPYDESLGRALHASAKLLYGRDADKPGALRRGLRRWRGRPQDASRRAEALGRGARNPPRARN